MITPEYARLFARYNCWQNKSLYDAASALSDDERKAKRGAFFGSIHATLNHLLWGDQIWMSRLAGTPRPKAESIPDSTVQFEDWDALKHERVTFDQVMSDWTEGITPEALAGDLTWYSGATGRELTKPRWVCVIHLFNHATHHRGQVHCLLTQLGCKPEATDIPFMPE